jgi:hypothetical protein
MRFAVLFFAVLLGVGAFIALSDSGPEAEPNQESLVPLAPQDEDLGAASEESTGFAEALPSEPTQVVPAAPELGEREEANFSGQNLVEFHGSAMLQPKGQRPYPAVRGSIEIAILNHGRLVPVTVDVNQGKFQVEVPDRCRLRIDGGVLEDQAVRILGAEGLITLDADQPYTLIGEPIPVNRLRVFEGTQRVPLAGVTVRTAQDGSTARMAGADAVGEVLVADAASPIDLPYLPQERPVWLHVSAEGYATTALLLKPQQANEKDVVLWPAATLTVRVTGKLRNSLKALTIHRHEPAAESSSGSQGTGSPAKRHFATFPMNAPGITTDTEATIFSVENVPALPLTIEARGFDKRGRETLLGSTSVELGPDQAGTVELRLREQ